MIKLKTNSRSLFQFIFLGTFFLFSFSLMADWNKDLVKKIASKSQNCIGSSCLLEKVTYKSTKNLQRGDRVIFSNNSSADSMGYVYNKSFNKNTSLFNLKSNKEKNKKNTSLAYDRNREMLCAFSGSISAGLFEIPTNQINSTVQFLTLRGFKIKGRLLMSKEYSLELLEKKIRELKSSYSQVDFFAECAPVRDR